MCPKLVVDFFKIMFSCNSVNIVLHFWVILPLCSFVQNIEMSVIYKTFCLLGN